MAKAKGTTVLSPREKVWARAEKFLSERKTLEELRRLSPEEFEELVTNLFSAQGYDAKAVGKAADGGVDVDIRDKLGKGVGRRSMQTILRAVPSNCLAGS
jgi:restriction endonuclease Mrr